MALTLPAKIKDYQDRKFMTLEADDYLFILKEFHRLLRRTLEPSVYTVFCAIEDHAGPGEQIDCPPLAAPHQLQPLARKQETAVPPYTGLL
jgi:hypothetical protein